MKKYIAALLALVMIFALAACGSKSESGELAEIKEKGKLVVGITDFEPMDYKAPDGSWIGFDADMAADFAQYLDVEVEFVEIDWDNKIMELNGKNVDCIWNGMTLTDEVKSAMDCSVPYCNNAQIVVMKADVIGKYPDAESMKDLTFAVEAGSAGEAAAEEQGFNTTPVQTQAAALMEVAAGTSDACIIDSLMAAAMVGAGTSYADLAYAVPLTEEFYGVGFRQGSNLVEAFNEFFANAVESGRAQELAAAYGVQAALIEK